MCCATGMCPGPWVGGGGGLGGSKDAPSLGKILLSPIGWMRPHPFFNPTIETTPPLSKVYLRPCVPPSPLFFLKILRDSQVPQLENLGALLSVSVVIPVPIFTPVQAPSAKKKFQGPSYRINLDAYFSIRIFIIWLSILHFHSYWNSTR